MRSEFISALTELAQADPRIVFLTADLGYTVVEPFREKFPERFFNVGVAEQNMMGIATALAKEGFLPFVYSIANFAVLRPLEFIRNGPINHQLPVRIIGVGSGFDYGSAGITHYNLEDIAVLRPQKGLTLAIPADKNQIKTMLEKTVDLPGPVYYRIAKGGAASITGLQNKFGLGEVIELSEGKDIAIVTMGAMVPEVMKASDILSSKGIFSSVYVVSAFNPSCDEAIKEILGKFPMVMSVEDHYTTGGLGSFVCETIAQSQLACRAVVCGVDAKTIKTTGSRDFMNEHYGLSAAQLAEKAVMSLKRFGNEKPSYLHNTSYPQTV